VKYVSTRGEAAGRGFAAILLEGLAPDGGLYVPERYPQVDTATLATWRRLSYPDLAFAVMSRFVDDIAPADLSVRPAGRQRVAHGSGGDGSGPLQNVAAALR